MSYEQLLDVFWNSHNPTTPNRQGPDLGTQYSSVIFYHTPQLREKAINSKEALRKSKKWKDPIITQILPATVFYKAEEYHQKYLKKRNLSTCHI